jgi:hypothetical protein
MPEHDKEIESTFLEDWGSESTTSVSRSNSRRLAALRLSGFLLDTGTVR